MEETERDKWRSETGNRDTFRLNSEVHLWKPKSQ